MRSRVAVAALLVLPALLTAAAAVAVAAAVANDEAPTPAPTVALGTSAPSRVSLLPFFVRGRRSLMLDAGITKPSSANDSGDSDTDKKDKGGGGGGGGGGSSSSSSSSSKKGSDRSVSSCSRVRGGRFRCSEGSNEAVGPLGTMGG